jgi:ABC-type sulfate transport system substrate-binding protein
MDQVFLDSAQTVLASAAPNENDKAVMASIADRFRNSEAVTQDDTTDAPNTIETNPLTPTE